MQGRRWSLGGYCLNTFYSGQYQVTCSSLPDWASHTLDQLLTLRTLFKTFLEAVGCALTLEFLSG